GYTDKQKVAAHLFWQHMAGLFVDEDGSKILGFPADWNSLIAYIEDFESRPWPPTESGMMVTQAILDQFAYRWFPAPLRGLGRAMAASPLHPNCWKPHRVAAPGLLARRILLRATGLMIRLGQLVAPDPDRTYYEDLTAVTRDQRAARIRRI